MVTKQPKVGEWRSILMLFPSSSQPAARVTLATELPSKVEMEMKVGRWKAHETSDHGDRN